MMDTIRLNGLNGSLSFKVIKRLNPSSLDFWDGNWLLVEVRCNMDNLACVLQSTLRSEDFLKMKEDYEKSEVLSFDTLEEGVSVKQLQIVDSSDETVQIFLRSSGGQQIECTLRAEKLQLDKFAETLDDFTIMNPIVGV